MASFPKPVAITCTNANNGAGVRATNRTTGTTNTAIVKSGKAVVELTGYTTGDVIDIRISGAYFGANTLTVTSAKTTPQSATISMTQSTTTNAPAINF